MHILIDSLPTFSLLLTLVLRSNCNRLGTDIQSVTDALLTFSMVLSPQ